MSYTRKEVSWQAHGKQDAYGDMPYLEKGKVKVRKQPKQSIIKTSEGKELLSKSYFYVDPRIEPRALEILEMDKLDGERIVERYVMCDLGNKPKLVRFITV